MLHDPYNCIGAQQARTPFPSQMGPGLLHVRN